MKEFTIYGYTPSEWRALKETLERHNLKVDQVEMIDTYLRAGIDSFTKRIQSLDDLDDRIALAVTRGVSDADAEALHENSQLRHENARLEKFLRAVQQTLEDYRGEEIPF